MGLAGPVLIEDEESGRLLLPKQWGIDDVPVIVGIRSSPPPARSTISWM